MSEEKNVTTKTIGYSFNITIERETRTVTDAKYPDKTITKASLGGHAGTFEEVAGLLGKATEEIRKQLDGGEE